MNLMYITFYHFWFWILATGQRRCLKWERKMSAENFWSQKVVHCTFPSFDSISLKQTYCILYGKYCSVKCRRRIRKFLQKKFFLSERIFLVIHTRSLFRPPLISSVIQSFMRGIHLVWSKYDYESKCKWNVWTVSFTIFFKNLLCLVSKWV